MPQKTFSVNFESEGLRSTVRKMNRMGDEADDAGSSLQTAGKVGAAAVGAITAAASAAVGGMAALVSKTAEYAKNVDRAAAQSGMTAESIQEIAFAANQVSGTSFDAVRDGMKELALRSQEAAMGTGEAKEAFDKLGISQQFLKESSTAEIFQRVRQELQGASARMRTFAAETILGGEAGQKMVEVLGLSADQMQRLRGEARKSGQVLSGEQVQALENARMSWSKLTSSVSGAGRQFAAQLAPVVTGTVIPALRSMIGSVRSVASAISNLSNTTKGIIATVTGLTGAISAGLALWASWPAIIGGVTAAFSGLTTAATTAWAAITSPVAAVIGAVAAVGAAAYLIYDNWSKVSDFFTDLFDGIVSVTKIFGKQIVARFRQAWLQVKKLFAQSINGLISLINDGLTAIGAENMQIEGEVGVPSEALAQNRSRLQKLQKDMRQATDRANAQVEESGGEMIDGFTSTVTEAYNSMTGLFSDIGGFFSVESRSSQQNQGSSSGREVSSGGSSRSGSASAGQNETLIDSGFDPENINISREVETMREKLGLLGETGKRVAGTINRGFNRVSRGLGRSFSALVTGRETFRSFGEVAANALQSVISKLATMATKMAAMKGIKTLFGAGVTAATGGIGGALFSGIGGLLGFANGGIVTGPTLGVIGEGTEDEAVMPLSKLNQFVNQSGGGGGGTVQSSGSARLAQGSIEIPVEVVDKAGRRGARQSARTGR